MILKRNGAEVNCFLPYYSNKIIIVGVDTSKTNTAIYILDEFGMDLDYYELNGSQDTDVLDLCWKERKESKELFRGADIRYCGIENIITKKSEGLDRHASRFKITSVFMSFISFFQDNHGFTPELVNNQEWKHAVLPTEYNTKEYAKGSLAWLKAINSKLQYCTDDVTDAYCIAKFMCIKYHIKNVILIKSPEAPTRNYKFKLISNDIAKSYIKLDFKYNPELTIQQNANVIGNNMQDKPYGVAIVNIDYLAIEDIYSLCEGDFTRVERDISLCVSRE